MLSRSINELPCSPPTTLLPAVEWVHMLAPIGWQRLYINSNLQLYVQFLTSTGLYAEVLRYISTKTLVGTARSGSSLSRPCIDEPHQHASEAPPRQLRDDKDSTNISSCVDSPEINKEPKENRPREHEDTKDSLRWRPSRLNGTILSYNVICVKKITFISCWVLDNHLIECCRRSRKYLND